VRFSAATTFGIMAGMVAVSAARILKAYGVDRALEMCTVAPVLTFIILMTITLSS
jgi:hypothetical protein